MTQRNPSLERAVVWLYYYLGVSDGISVSLETLKTLNPEPLKDHECRVKLRGLLPPELAALREPNADIEPASKLIEREVLDAVQRVKLQRLKKREKSKIQAAPRIHSNADISPLGEEAR